MSYKEYEQHEEEFLTAMADRFGFIGNNRLVFLERFKTDNIDLTNTELADVLSPNLGENANQKFRDSLAKNIYPQLIKIGCQLNTNPRNKWSEGRRWLKEEEFPKWLNNRNNIYIESKKYSDIINTIRKQIGDRIKFLCGTIRVLDMSEPIALNQLFTKVNVLTQITSTRRKQVKEILPEVRRQDIHDLPENILTGLEAVEKFQRLIILGSPGAGKTTFLRYLAMQSIEEKCIDLQCLENQIEENNCQQTQCSAKQNLKQLVPFFIALKNFAEVSDRQDLLSYIQGQFPVDPPEDIEIILKEGKGLILLDGLDEVKQAARITINKRIESFIQNWYQNKFVISCRLAAKDYNFEQFTEVEITNFQDQQIETFIKRWFERDGNDIKGRIFLEKLYRQENKPIQELASNPLLLTLLCLVFEGAGIFPLNRSGLYKEALDILLRRWDANRNIERDEIYHRLSLQRKEQLLEEIAYSTFKNNQYVFQQKTIAGEIDNYLERLFQSDNQREIDAEVILKSIEAQHGLLVQRARGFYCFSHLTFQEYFTARYIFANCDPNSSDSSILQESVEHLTEPAWREVFLLLVEMLPSSDVLLQLMKAKTDKILAEDEDLQKFLQWVKMKAESLASVTNNKYKLAALRANYLDFDIALDYDRTLGWLISPDFTLIFTCASFLARAKQSSIEDTFNQIPCLSEYENLEQAMAIISVRKNIIDQLVETVGSESEFGQKLTPIKTELDGLETMKNTLSANAYREKMAAWGDQVREALVPYHSLGENWRYPQVSGNLISHHHQIYEFSDRQMKLLREYYYANLLLITCLQSEISITRRVRKEIEANLLLPINV